MRELSTLQVNTGSTFEGFCPFPVGYIYQSTDSTSPADLYGGTWSALTDGRFLRPAEDTTTGGANTHTHRTIVGYDFNANNLYFSDDKGVASVVTTGVGMVIPSYKNASGAARQSNTFSASSIPAYRGCYVWYRTA